MTVPDSNDAFKKAFDLKLTLRILTYLRPYVPLVVTALTVALLLAVLSPLPTLVQKHAIDTYLTPFVRNPGLNAETLYHGLTLAALGYMGLKGLEFVLNYASTLAIGYLGQNVLRDIRADVFSKLQRLHLAFFDQNPVGRLITRVTSDVDAINQFITGG